MRLFLVNGPAITPGATVGNAQHLIRDMGFRLSILCSFHFFRTTNLVDWMGKNFEEPYPEVLADSGGFSAWSKGVEVRVEDYAAWLKKNQSVITYHINLDVIGDHVGTLRNQKWLEDAGVPPIPTFHTNEPWEQLEEYIENYQFITLGGMVPHVHKTALFRWVLECFKRRRPGTVYHGLGLTGRKYLEAFPFFSVDSSNWAAGMRYGQLPVWDPMTKRMRNIHTRDYQGMLQLKRMLMGLGMDVDRYIELFSERPKIRNPTVLALAALSYCALGDYAERVHGPVELMVEEDVA